MYNDTEDFATLLNQALHMLPEKWFNGVAFNFNGWSPQEAAAYLYKALEEYEELQQKWATGQ